MNFHNLAVRFSARGVFVLFLLTALTSSFAHAFGANKVDVWLTTPDKRYLLAEQPTRLPFTKASPNAKAIVVDDQRNSRPWMVSAMLSLAVPRN